MKNTRRPIHRLTVSALCLALCLILPFFTGQIPKVGNFLSPMHIPVFLAGFLCGGTWGAAVGFMAPLLRSLLFHMPPLYPKAIAMAAELLTYGLVAGTLYRRFEKKAGGLYVSLFIAMLAGRGVWGMTRYALAGLAGEQFPFSLFLAGAFTEALPGIFLQIVAVPILVMALKNLCE